MDFGRDHTHPKKKLSWVRKKYYSNRAECELIKLVKNENRMQAENNIKKRNKN